MVYNDKIFCEQYVIVKTFFYHLTCYRELFQAYKDLEVNSEFWTRTIDAHLLQACILWSMVFGSVGSNPTHWKKICDTDLEKLEHSFREGLYKKYGIKQEILKTYWRKVREFRGGYVAHRELNYSGPVPELGTAEAVAYFYDEWIRELIAPDSLEEPPLKESVFAMKKEIRPLVMYCLSGAKLFMPNTD